MARWQLGRPTTARPLRADARRNREAILRAAREAFEAEGVFTSLDGVAARAGVGNATLYRNFPTRDDLLAAVIETSTAEVLAEADELARTTRTARGAGRVAGAPGVAAAHLARPAVVPGRPP